MNDEPKVYYIDVVIRCVAGVRIKANDPKAAITAAEKWFDSQRRSELFENIGECYDLDHAEIVELSEPGTEDVDATTEERK